MKHRNKQREIQRAMYHRVEKYQRLILEIKGFPFKIRMQIAWAVVRGNRSNK